MAINGQTQHTLTLTSSTANMDGPSTAAAALKEEIARLTGS